MKRLFATALVLAAFAPASAAQTSASFTGTWGIDAAKPAKAK